MTGLTPDERELERAVLLYRLAMMRARTAGIRRALRKAGRRVRKGRAL